MTVKNKPIAEQEQEQEGTDLRLDVTNVLERNMNSPCRIRVNEGGTGSSKTISILQLIIFHHCMERSGQTISIVRSRFAEMRATVMRDFIDLLIQYDLYDEKAHNRSTHTYILNGNTIEFIGIDMAHKKRGAKRDILYVNEGQSLLWEDYFQLYIRTRGVIYIDYNPDMLDHWIYDRVLLNDEKPNPNAELIVSTYLDNPFLPDEIRKAIEELDSVDPDLAAVYKYGKRANIKGVILKKAVVRDESEWPENVKWRCFGTDFGYTQDPTTLIEVAMADGELWARQRIWSTGLLSQDLSNMFHVEQLSRSDEIVADSADPRMIAELRAYGWNMIPAEKGPDSVRFGLNLLIPFTLNVIGRDLAEEVRKYKYKVDPKTGKVTNVPIDAYNHGIDPLRYVATHKIGESNTFSGARPKTIQR